MALGSVAIARIHKPTREEFEQHFLSPQKPCVITGAIDDWRALSAWTINYLKTKIGDTIVPCRVSHNDYFDNYHAHKHIKLAVFLDWILANEQQNAWDVIFQKKNKTKYFVGSLDIPSYFSEILADIKIPNYFDSKLLTSQNLWIGQGNNRVNLHYDFFHNLNAQIVGQKHWFIFPPEQSSCLYPHPWYTKFFWCSQVNINQPDLQKFPKFSEITPLEVITNPGEILFLPSGWWHSPVGIGTNIAVNFWWRMSLKEIVNLLSLKVLNIHPHII